MSVVSSVTQMIRLSSTWIFPQHFNLTKVSHQVCSVMNLKTPVAKQLGGYMYYLKIYMDITTSATATDVRLFAHFSSVQIIQ